MTAHSTDRVRSIFGALEFKKNESAAQVGKFSNKEMEKISKTHPLLFPVASFQGINISPGLHGAPFFENSLAIFERSLSALSLSMTGTPSTTTILSSPSSSCTRYLFQPNRVRSSARPKIAKTSQEGNCCFRRVGYAYFASISE